MLFHNSKNDTELKVIHLNKKQQEKKQKLEDVLQGKKSKGVTFKLKKCFKKSKNKNAAKDQSKQSSNNVFVLDFKGDVKADAVKQLREEISTLISVAKKEDEVVIRLESPGGIVHAYGLAAAQLARLKEAGLAVTICVDKVAASGGYMMACVADKIYSAPFAVIGSIGVVAQIPNFNKLLKNHDVDFEQFTAGDFKRTVTMFGENDDDDREKFQEEIEQTHTLFKNFVAKYRPSLQIDKVATGEHWYGEDALKLGLVDDITTSDAYLLKLMDTHQVYALTTKKKQTFADKLGFANAAVMAVDSAIDKLPELMNKIEHQKY